MAAWSPTRRRWAVVGGIAGVVLLVVVAFLLYLQSPSGHKLGQREFVVTFASSATVDMHDAVRETCPGGGNVTLEPKPTGTTLASRVYDVRYRIDRADDAEVARLAVCVGRQPGVLGFSIPSDDNS